MQTARAWMPGFRLWRRANSGEMPQEEPSYVRLSRAAAIGAQGARVVQAAAAADGERGGADAGARVGDEGGDLRGVCDRALALYLLVAEQPADGELLRGAADFRGGARAA